MGRPACATDADRTTREQALLDTRALFRENPIGAFVITAPIAALGAFVTTALASGLPEVVLVAAGALGGACIAVIAVWAWMWARAFPLHNAWARAALKQGRVEREAAVADAQRRSAITEERLKVEIDNALADARRGDARARLYRELREGRAYVAKGMIPGVSGVAPLGVLLNWTNQVVDHLTLLGIAAPQLQSGGSPAVAAGSTDRTAVRVEFERRLDVLEDLIERRLI